MSSPTPTDRIGANAVEAVREEADWLSSAAEAAYDEAARSADTSDAEMAALIDAAAETLDRARALAVAALAKVRAEG